MADREKKAKMEIQKFEYLEKENRFLDEMENIFQSYGRAIIWEKNRNLIKNSGQKL